MSALDDLEADIRNLAVLVETVTELVVDHPTMTTTGEHRDHLNKVGSLLWIARNLCAQVLLSAGDANRSTMRMTGPDRGALEAGRPAHG